MNTTAQQDHRERLQSALLAVRNMRNKLSAIEYAQTEPLAVIGIGCRFPHAVNSPDTFWSLLHNGIDAISEVPEERGWSMEQLYDPDPGALGKLYVRSGGFLDNVDRFDARFFGITPREAIHMDPQQRLLLEVCWEALEHAGQSPDALRGSQTGVFVGIVMNDYLQIQSRFADRTAIDAYSSTGNHFNAAAGRLAYTLGFQGPAMAVDTACSSSLVAVHLASQSLRSRDCDMAVVGGVNLALSPDGFIATCRAGMLAPDGHCKTFDAAADGYARGEGCGLIVLKRVSDAIAAGDNILALIRGSAVNQDGPSSGLTVPNGPAQQAVIRKALTNGGLNPQDISYVEAHGTGTALGDPIEIESLAAALGEERTADNPLVVGSVKTNIGHLESAAGIAGLIKLVLSLQHEEIPPHLNLKTPNPLIPWQELPVRIPTTAEPWPRSTQPRRASISSFGFSGTNSHVIVEEAPLPEAPTDTATDTPQPQPPLQLLTLSAKTDVALKQLASRYEMYLVTHPQVNLADVCFSANTGRQPFDHRLAAVASSPEQLIEQLEAFQAGTPVKGLTSDCLTNHSRPKVAFLFTGQGSQVFQMGQQLYETQTTFRQIIDRCDQILRDTLEHSLLSVLYATDSSDLIHQTAYTQPALFAIEYALAELWRSWGVEPDIVAGHSIGEYVAACVAGLYDLETGLHLIAERGRLMQALPADGAMVAVVAPAHEVSQVLESLNSTVEIAAFNGPGSTVISGPAIAITQARSELTARGLETIPLQVQRSFHSAQMDPILVPFGQTIAQRSFGALQIELVSSLTGQLATTAEMTQSDYWQQQIRQPVQFETVMETLQRQNCNIYLEIGAHPILTSLGQQCLPTPEALWLPSLSHGKDDWQILTESLGQLALRGLPIDWKAFNQGRPRQRLPLPTYPFERQRFWVDVQESADNRHQQLPSNDSSTAGVDTEPATSQSLQQQVLALTATITGLTPDHLGLDMALEGELGLDSIMMTQLVNGLIKLIPSGQQKAFSQQFGLRDLMQLQTLQDIITALEPWTQSTAVSVEQTVNIDEERVSITPDQSIEGELVEVLHGQYFHLIGYWLVDSTSLFATVRLEGDFSLAIAQQSWQDLIARHPMLRARFHVPSQATRFNHYKLEVLKHPVAPPLALTDLRHLDADAQAEALQEERLRLLNYRWSLTQWPLQQFSVFQLDDSVYQLFLGNEHVIADGLGVHIILREFLELYRARAVQQAPDLLPPTTLSDYTTLVSHINNWQNDAEDQALETYTQQQGKEAYCFNPSSRPFQYAPPQYDNQNYCLDSETTAQLIDRTRAWRVPVNSLLVGAFLRAVAQVDSTHSSLILQIPTGGRVYPDADASHVISSFAQNLALNFSLPQPNESWDSLLTRVHETIQTNLANGIDRAQTRQMGTTFRDNIPLEAGKVPDLSLSIFHGAIKSNLYLPYTGQTHIKSDYGPLKVTDYRAGGINAAGIVDILQEIFDDRLHLFASYDRTFFDQTNIDQLVTAYIEQIKALVAAIPPVVTPPVSAPLPQANQLPTSTTDDAITLLQQIAGSICPCPIGPQEFHLDLEADLGMDSLDQIRLVAHLEKRLGTINRQALLRCRSLHEIAQLLGSLQTMSR